jgi:hypothetical protein
MTMVVVTHEIASSSWTKGEIVEDALRTGIFGKPHSDRVQKVPSKSLSHEACRHSGMVRRTRPQMCNRTSEVHASRAPEWR